MSASTRVRGGCQEVLSHDESLGRGWWEEFNVLEKGTEEGVGGAA